MKTPFLVAALLAVMGIGLLLQQAFEADVDHLGVTRGAEHVDVPEAFQRPLLDNVGSGVPVREAQGAGPASLEQGPHLAPAGPVRLAPLDIEIINGNTGEPAPFVGIDISDFRGASMSGVTDRWGRLRGPSTLAAGPLAVNTVVRTKMVRRQTFVLDREKRVGEVVTYGRANLASPEDIEGEDPAAQCTLDLARYVPVRLNTQGEVGPQPGSLPAELGMYGTDASSTTSVRMKTKLAMLALPDLEGHLAGATHILTLEDPPAPTSVDVALAPARPTAADLAWARAGAADLNVRRELEVYGFVNGRLHGARVQVTRVPNLGDAPIEASLQPLDPSTIKLPSVRVRYSSMASKQQALFKITRAENARESYGLMINVTSASGSYAGSVSVRASPTAKSRNAHPETADLPLRKQWIEAAFTRVGGGVLGAEVHLDALDAVEYEIRVVCLDGEPSTVDPIRIAIPYHGPSPVEILLPDR